MSTHTPGPATLKVMEQANDLTKEAVSLGYVENTRDEKMSFYRLAYLTLLMAERGQEGEAWQEFADGIYASVREFSAAN